MLLLVQMQSDKAVTLLAGNVKKVPVKSVIDQLASMPHIQCEVCFIIHCIEFITYDQFACDHHLILD